MNTHDVWENIHKVKDWGKYPSEHVIRFVAKNYYGLQRDCIKILDFGCGGGAHTWYLAKEGFDVYAFDISETSVRKTAKYLESENLRANLSVKNGLSLDYDDRFFDAVIDNCSIQSNCYKEISTMYTNCFRVLNNGGKLITTVFSRDTTGYGTGKMIEPGTFSNLESGRLQHTGCRHFFDESELRLTLENCGFSNISIEKNIYIDSANNRTVHLIGVGEKNV